MFKWCTVTVIAGVCVMPKLGNISGAIVRCILGVSLSVVLSGCGPDSVERVVREQTKPKPAKPPVEPLGEPRLLTGQELKDALVGAAFRPAQRGISSFLFQEDGTYLGVWYGETAVTSRSNYEIFQQKFCIYDFESKNKICCVKTYEISKSKYKFLSENMEDLNDVGLWIKEDLR
jgi:hypothetical protein